MSGTILDNILAVKRARVDLQKRETDLAALKENARIARQSAERHRLRSALSRKDRTSIIGEIKRASPSKGVINSAIDAAAVAKSYRNGGAAAISVLTEEDFFQGSLDDLIAVRNAADLPILRKDFVIDEFQIYESAAAGADAILLIVAALNAEILRYFLRLVQNDLGMDAIVEVHTTQELEVAAGIDADIIGVNNRSLETFEVSLDVSRQLIKNRPANTLMVAESGISTLREIDELRKLGFNGFLVGETLMRSSDIEKELRKLTTDEHG